jgi:hypothetical protein
MIKINWSVVLDNLQFGLVEELKRRCPTHDGDLRKSISSRATDNQLTIYAIYYAMYVNDGTMPHMPPVDALKKWARDKLGDENLAWAVANKIKKYGCFFGNSHRYKILTKRGYKALKDVQIGDLVLTHKNQWKKVVDKPIYNIKDRIERYIITTESGKKVTVTEEHPFRVKTNKGYIWKKAKHLTENDIVLEVV